MKFDSTSKCEKKFLLFYVFGAVRRVNKLIFWELQFFTCLLFREWCQLFRTDEEDLLVQLFRVTMRFRVRGSFRETVTARLISDSKLGKFVVKIYNRI